MARGRGDARPGGRCCAWKTRCCWTWTAPVPSGGRPAPSRGCPWPGAPSHQQDGPRGQANPFISSSEPSCGERNQTPACYGLGAVAPWRHCDPLPGAAAAMRMTGRFRGGGRHLDPDLQPPCHSSPRTRPSSTDAPRSQPAAPFCSGPVLEFGLDAGANTLALTRRATGSLTPPRTRGYLQISHPARIGLRRVDAKPDAGSCLQSLASQGQIPAPSLLPPSHLAKKWELWTSGQGSTYPTVHRPLPRTSRTNKDRPYSPPQDFYFASRSLTKAGFGLKASLFPWRPPDPDSTVWPSQL